MVIREHYLKKIRPFYDSDLIKVITGIRRCGKSVVREQIEAELESEGRRVYSLNFELRSVSSAITDADELISDISAHLGQEKLYVFLDEIQLIKDWHIACRSLRLENISLFITGSNSRLLSGEFTRELSGRYVAFRIRPFVYKEIAEYGRQLGRTRGIGEYLLYGGFPKSLEYEGADAVLQYLNDLDEQIVLRDIMSRHSIRQEELFRRFADYVMISNSRIFSANSIKKYLEGQGIACSINTVQKYLMYMEEAYAICSIPQYSAKAKRRLSYYEKLYDEDVAFNTIRQGLGHYDLTHNFENIIYNELVYMDFELYVYRVGDREIDFLAQRGGRQYLIQAAYSIAEEKTYEREFAAFNTLDQSRKKIIITNDDADFSTSTVRHISFSKFLTLDGAEEL